MHTQANGSGRQQRRLALWLGWLAVLGLAGSMWSAAAQDLPPEVLEAQTKRIQAIERVKPAVVAVFDRGRKGGGSGVLIDERGYALTNYHVVEPTGPFMQCGLPDGVLYDAVLVGIDKVGDVALIKLLPKQPGQKFPTAPLGDSDKVKIGDWAMSMGNPFLLAVDFAPTVTYGLVSGTNRWQFPQGELLEYTDCIQVDMSINPGNSGGPLFNMDGEIIGINGRISPKRGRVNSGAGYAISSNQIKNFLGHLYGGLDMDHASLGATVRSEGEDGEFARMVVQEVLDGTDVARRGLEPEDELVAFAGRPMGSVNQYKNVLGIYPEGWRLPLTYRRNNEKREVLVRLQPLRAQAKEPPAKQGPGPIIGKQPAPPPDPELAKLYKAKKGFANYYFNELERDRVLAALAKHGDFATLTGSWSLALDVQLKKTKRPGKLELRQRGPDGDPIVLYSLGAGVEYDLEPLKDQSIREKQDPPGSGGLLMAMYVYRRLLTLGAKGFEGGFVYGGFEPAYPVTGDAYPPKHWKDQRVDCDVIKATHIDAVSKFYFDRKDGKLIGLEMSLARDEDPCEVYFSDYRPVNGRQFPHRFEVRRGMDRFAVLTVQQATLGSAQEGN